MSSTAGGDPAPVLITSVVKTDKAGEPTLIRTTIFDARDRRAAALTSLIRYTLRTAAVYDAEPATVLRTLNGALHQQYLRDDRSFCTVIFGVLTPDGDGFTLALARGGHAAPLLMRAEGSVRYLPMPLGPLIGAWADGAFTGTMIRLGPGDTLLLFTDGLTEARAATTDPSGRYGDEAFRLFARGLAPRTATAAVGAIAGLLESFGAGIEDDTAVLALGVPDKPRLSAPVNPGRPRRGPGRTSARPGS